MIKEKAYFALSYSFIMYPFSTTVLNPKPRNKIVKTAGNKQIIGISISAPFFTGHVRYMNILTSIRSLRTQTYFSVTGSAENNGTSDRENTSAFGNIVSFHGVLTICQNEPVRMTVQSW